MKENPAMFEAVKENIIAFDNLDAVYRPAQTCCKPDNGT